MTRPRVAAAAGAVVLPFALGAAALPGADDGERVVRFTDRAIVESSGLAWVHGLLVTVNDSGDTGRVFAVDPATGHTVGTTSWSEEPRDVEALAPAGDGAVWVGDIGDNTGSRDDLTVFRVPVGRGERTVEPTAYSLVYADGPRDAETLLAHPRTGRLYVVSKGIWDGYLYAAPRRLSAGSANILRRVGTVLPVATDGAFFPDGRHLVLRSYLGGALYSFPDLDLVADLPLPDQEQGEGVAVTPDGEVLLSSEGLRQWVLRVALPRTAREALAEDPARREATSGDRGGTSESSTERWSQLRDRDAWPVWLGGAGLAVLALWVVRRRHRAD